MINAINLLEDETCPIPDDIKNDKTEEIDVDILNRSFDEIG